MTCLRLSVSLGLGVAIASSGCFLDTGPYQTNDGGDGAGADGGSSGAAGGTSSDMGGGGAGGSTTSTQVDPETCGTAADCDDGDPCTADACPVSTCQHTPLDDQTVIGDDDKKDCRKRVCQGGVAVDVAEPTQTPDPDPSGCKVYSCLGIEIVPTPVNQGLECGTQPGNPCEKNICDGGACTLVSLQDGTLLAKGDTDIDPGDVSKDCRDIVCQGGAQADSPNTSNCKDPNPTNCLVPSCTELGFCVGVPAPFNTPCDKNASLDGKCDLVGTCL